MAYPSQSIKTDAILSLYAVGYVVNNVHVYPFEENKTLFIQRTLHRCIYPKWLVSYFVHLHLSLAEYQCVTHVWWSERGHLYKETSPHFTIHGREGERPVESQEQPRNPETNSGVSKVQFQCGSRQTTDIVNSLTAKLITSDKRSPSAARTL